MKRYIGAAIQSLSDMDPIDRRELAETTDNPDILTELVNDDDYQTTLNAIANPNLPISLMYSFSDAEWDFRQALAQNPNLPDDLIIKLLNDSDVDVSKHLIWNPKLTEGEVEYLVSHLSKDATRHLTIFDDTAPIVLDRLSKYCKDVDTLIQIARNPNVSAEILDRLSEDYDVYVRCAVALNPNLSQSTIRYMLEDVSLYVRECLAANPNIPRDYLQVLAMDDSPRVRQRAEQYLRESEQ